MLLLCVGEILRSGIPEKNTPLILLPKSYSLSLKEGGGGSLPCARREHHLNLVEGPELKKVLKSERGEPLHPTT